MATYFQHLEPGDNLGKVTQLKYIDDISDDFIFYHFEDGTICNKDFIASPDNVDAFNGKFVMAELYSPTAVWTFDKKTIVIDEKKTWTNPETGETFDIAPPGVQQNGQYGGTFGDAKATAKDGQTRISATAPVFHGNKDRREDLSKYTLSVNPDADKDLADNTINTVNPVSEDKTEEKIPEYTQGYIEIKRDSIIGVDSSYYFKSSSDLLDKLSCKTIDINTDPNIIINTDQFNDNSDIKIIIDDTEYTYNKEEFVELFTSSKHDIIEEKPDSIKFIQEYLDSEDVLITNMIEKSKKVSSDIGMDITVTLPPKEVYNTIKNVYSEEMSDNFIKSLAYRIPVRCLIESIANGLSVFYDEEKSKMLSEENEQ